MGDKAVHVVTVKTLQQNLSTVLGLAESGHVVRVTSRGRPKAVILPPEAEGFAFGALGGVLERARLEQGAREGWIQPPVVNELPDLSGRGFKGKMSTTDALREDRDA